MPEFEMSLRKALRMKNALKGEIADLASSIKRNNVYDERKHASNRIDTAKQFEEYNAKKGDLIELKDAIQKANVPIYKLILEVAEIKDKLTLLENVSTDVDPIRSGMQKPDGTELMYCRFAGIKAEDVARCKAECKEKLEDLLGRIDDFNSVTKIAVELSKKPNSKE